MTESGLGEAWARLELACLSELETGEYECRGQIEGGKHVSVVTRVRLADTQIGQMEPSCIPKIEPVITGWLSTLMVPSGEVARFTCTIQVSFC